MTKLTELEENDARGPAIVIRGSVMTGFKFIGPFPTIADALAWHESTLHGLLDVSCVIDLLESPGNSNPEGSIPK